MATPTRQPAKLNPEACCSVSKLDEHQREIAVILFSLPEATHYALAGGAALIAHGTIERPTRDLDAFIEAQPTNPAGDVAPLLQALLAGLRSHGWDPEIIREHQTFARLVAEKHSAVVEIDLAVDSPRLFPTEVVDGLPMLSRQDLAARKILAILDRAEGRDFCDLEVLQILYTRPACIAWAQQLDTGLTTAAIARSFTNLERLDDKELPTPSPEETRRLFATWVQELSPADN